MSEIETITIRKVAKRLLPLIFLLYVVCLIDRVNLSFAALTMNRDLGLNAYVYGLGASIFFIGYFVFEVPSNLLLDRVGARLWITRIMISWGLASAAMALVSGETSFLIVRFLLGFFEAGFFPGMILYLTFWFPSAYRARVIAAFMLAIPVTGVIGGPLATSMLELNGTLGLAGWQWMFLLEGIPAALMGFVVLAFMTDRPSRATWLRPEEKQWLEDTLHRERQEVENTHSRLSLWQALIDPRVLALSLVYFGIGTATYGVVYFLPQIIKGWGLSNLQTGFVSSIPDIVGTIGMVVWGYFSDRSSDRRRSAATALIVCTVGLVGLGLFGASPWSLIAMAMVSVGLNASRPLFWALPSLFLSRTAAAGAIALINALGNLGGIAGPTMLGWVKTTTGSFSGGLYFLGACTFVAAIVVMMAVRMESRGHIPGGIGRSIMRRQDFTQDMDDDPLPVMVPRSDKVLVQTPPERVRRLRPHLIVTLRALRKTKDTRRSAPLPEPQGFAARVAGTACGLCKGWCCKNGEDDAFLDEPTLLRVRRANPALNARAVLRLFIDRVPVDAYHGSCIFHGKQGCTLDRSLRSDVCNSYFCGGLQNYLSGGNVTTPAVVIAGEGNKMRTSSILTPI